MYGFWQQTDGQTDEQMGKGAFAIASGALIKCQFLIYYKLEIFTCNVSFNH